MTDLIKAADALAEEIEIRLENGCEICNGDCSAANPPVQSCPQQRRTKLLTAYRQARESADGVMVEELADAMAQELNGGFIDSATWYNGSQKDLWLQRAARIKAALDT